MPSAPNFARLAAGQGAVAGNASNASCQSCPSFLTPSKQVTVLGKSVSGNTCAKRLIAIGRPGLPNEEKQQKNVASKCAEYGKPAEFSQGSFGAAIEYNVAFPDVKAQTQPQIMPSRVRSCSNCSNYVPESIAEEKTGWRAGFCMAKGSLLLTDRLARYAAQCEFKSHTMTPIQWGDAGKVDIKLLPEHLESVSPNSPIAILKKMRDAGTDPKEYPTDKPVSPKAASLGVRAWRRIEDQTGFGPAVHLPVFDLHTIPENKRPAGWDLELELSKVPQSGDDERPEWYIDHSNFVYRVIVMWTKLGDTPALWGPAGVGKTELFRHISWMMQLPFERVSITMSSELDDIAGKMLFRNNETVWHHGRVSRAWGKPNVLCIDEPNVGPPDVWQFLRPLTDNSKQLVLDQDRGQRISAHDACYLGMAMNPAWDPRNVGAMELGDADGSRLMHLHMGLPPREIEEAIIKQRLLADKWAEDGTMSEVIRTLMNVAVDLRKLSDEGAAFSWGIRNQIKVARVKRYMRWIDAFRAGVADSLAPPEQEAILAVVRSHCPEED